MDFTEEEAADYLKYVPRLCNMVRDATHSDGVNVVSNAEHCAGQRVFHVHFHVVPRFDGDEMYDADYVLLRQETVQKITDCEAEEMLAKLHAVM